MFALDLLSVVLALGAPSHPAPAAKPAPVEAVRPAQGTLIVHAAPWSAARVRVGPRTEYGRPIRYAVVEHRGSWLGVITPARAQRQDLLREGEFGASRPVRS